jgi:hypothetical protein
LDEANESGTLIENKNGTWKEKPEKQQVFEFDDPSNR